MSGHLAIQRPRSGQLGGYYVGGDLDLGVGRQRQGARAEGHHVVEYVAQRALHQSRLRGVAPGAGGALTYFSRLVTCNADVVNLFYERRNVSPSVS